MRSRRPGRYVLVAEQGWLCPGHLFSPDHLLGAGGELATAEAIRGHLGCSDLIWTIGAGSEGHQLRGVVTPWGAPNRGQCKWLGVGARPLKEGPEVLGSGENIRVQDPPSCSRGRGHDLSVPGRLRGPWAQTLVDFKKAKAPQEDWCLGCNEFSIPGGIQALAGGRPRSREDLSSSCLGTACGRG